MDHAPRPVARTRWGTVRRALILLVAIIATACASASPPPGGPEDKMPPRVLRITPDTNSVNVKPDNVSVYFEEDINDRGSAEQEIDRYFLLSPSDGAPKVSWHRSRIDIRPRHGFQPNVGYTVTLLPGLSDLRSNRMKQGRTIVFSTGPTIPPYSISGIVFDWANERPASQAFIEALVPGPDSIRYLAQTDSTGHFTIATLPQGSYLVRAIMDQNSNRSLDRNEAFDTARVSTPYSGTLQLLAALRDTLPSRILTVAMVDSLTIDATFDRSLDPTVNLPASAFRLVGPDSTPVAILSAMSPRQIRVADSLSQRVREDSVRRADSLAGKPRPAPPAPVSAVPGAKVPAPPAKPPLPPPYTIVRLKIGKPLAQNTLYRLSVTGARGLSGRVDSSERTFTTPRPAPPRAPKDSTAAKPAPGAAPPARPPRS